MQLQLSALLLPLLSLTASAAPTAEEKRIPLIGGFTLSTHPVCPAAPAPGSFSSRYNIAYGSACGKCVNVTSPGVPKYNIIYDTYVDPKCTITLFQKADCTDDGIVTGPNCWTPDGGIRGYKVACPWWPENPPPGTLKPCSSS